MAKKKKLSKDEWSQLTLDIYRKYGKVTQNLFHEKTGYHSKLMTTKFKKKWNEILSDLDIPTNYHYDLSIEDICKDVKRVGELLQKTPTWDEYSKYGKYDIDNIRNRAGEWIEIQRMCNFVPYRNITPEEAATDIKKVYSENNECINTIIYIRDGRYGISNLCKIFQVNSFYQILDIINLPNNYKREKYDDQELLDILKKHYKLNGHVISRGFNSLNGLPCDRTYYDRFGSFTNAMKLANIPFNNKHEAKDGCLYDSKEEANLANILVSNFIEFEPHKRVCKERRWSCDFYLPSTKLWIEYDGLGETRKNKDLFQEKLEYYQKHQYNYIVLDRDDDILNMLDLKVKDWGKNDFETKNIWQKTVKEFLSNVHYMGNSVPLASKYKIGLYYKPLKLLCGVALFGKNANPHEDGLVLTRFATLDRVDGNIESHFLSRCIKHLRKKGFKNKVIAFSDPRFHLGTIYKASNFKKVLTKKYRDYVYLDIKSGKEYHKSVCRVKAGKSEMKLAEEKGLEKIFIPQKERWEYDV